MKKQRDLGLNLSTQRTRKAQFLDEMEVVVPWRELVALIDMVAPRKPRGRPPFGHETMLRLHFIQQWFGLSDFAMEEALFDVALYREFAGLSNSSRLPDRVSILRFRHLLEEHKLAEQMFATVNATMVFRYEMPCWSRCRQRPGAQRRGHGGQCQRRHPGSRLGAPTGNSATSSPTPAIKGWKNARPPDISVPDGMWP